LTYFDGVPPNSQINPYGFQQRSLISYEISHIYDIPPSKYLNFSPIFSRTKCPLLKCHQHHSAHGHGKLQSHLQTKRVEPAMEALVKSDEKEGKAMGTW